MYRWFRIRGKFNNSTEWFSELIAIITSICSGHMGEYKIQQYSFNRFLNQRYFDEVEDALAAIIKDLKYHYVMEVEITEFSNISHSENLIYYWYSLAYPTPSRDLPYASPRYPKLAVSAESAEMIIAKIKRAIYHSP